MLSTLTQALHQLVLAHPYTGLFLLLVIEEAGMPLPLPGDTLIMYAGTQTHAGWAHAVLTIAFSTLAAVLGSSMLFFVARRGGRPLLLRYGRVLHLHPERVDRMQARFLRWGPWAIILGRLIPGLRAPTGAMAGLFAVPYRVFLPCTTISALIWALFYFYVGVLLAPAWREALEFVGRELDVSVGIACGALGFVVAITVVVNRYRTRQRRQTLRRIRSESAGS